MSEFSLYIQYYNKILMGLDDETYCMGQYPGTGKEFLIWKITRQ